MEGYDLNHAMGEIPFGADCRGAGFRDSSLKGVGLNLADLLSADLRGSKILEGADFRGAVLKFSDLTRVRTKDARYDAQA